MKIYAYWRLFLNSVHLSYYFIIYIIQYYKLNSVHILHQVLLYLCVFSLNWVQIFSLELSSNFSQVYRTSLYIIGLNLVHIYASMYDFFTYISLNSVHFCVIAYDYVPYYIFELSSLLQLNLDSYIYYAWFLRLIYWKLS